MDGGLPLPDVGRDILLGDVEPALRCTKRFADPGTRHARLAVNLQFGGGGEPVYDRCWICMPRRVINGDR